MIASLGASAGQAGREPVSYLRGLENLFHAFVIFLIPFVLLVRMAPRTEPGFPMWFSPFLKPERSYAAAEFSRLCGLNRWKCEV